MPDGWTFWLPLAVACLDVLLTVLLSLFAYQVWRGLVHAKRRVNPREKDV